MAPLDDEGEASVESLRAAIAILDLGASGVWAAYAALGGDGSRVAVEGWLEAGAVPPERDYAVLAVVANEALVDRGLDPTVPSTLHPSSG